MKRVMSMMVTVVMVGLGALGLTACEGEVSRTAEFYEAALKGGCRWDCPKCKSNDQLCSMRPCVLVCPPKTVKCGPSVCTGGDVCCNESCGICTPQGGFCTEQFCAPVTDGCASDADCRTYASYCDGCSCQALGVGDPDPLCAGTLVQCFLDPCANQTARCDVASGRCVLQ